MRRRGAIVLVASAAAAAVLLAALLRRADPPLEPEPEEAVIRFTDTVFRGWREGELQWLIASEQIEQRPEDGVFFTEIREGALYSEGEAYLEFRAREGHWNPDTDVLRLAGSVQALRSGELVFQTDVLFWHGAEEWLHAPGTVELSVDGNQVRAEGMEADAKDDVLRLLGQVEILLVGGGRVRAPGRAEYHMESGRLATFGRAEVAMPFAEGAENRREPQGD